MYAQFVVDGYWIDLHISKPFYKKEDHVLFENLVKSAKFETKTNPVEDNDKTLESAQKVLEAWMPLWDEGKYARGLRRIIRFHQRSLQCQHMACLLDRHSQALGKLKTRTLTKSEHIKSLTGVPDREARNFSIRKLF